MDQHKLKIEQTEKIFSDSLTKMKEKIEQDTKINKEIEKYMNKTIGVNSILNVF